MAKVGPVKLKVHLKGSEATVDVAYDITFEANDQASNPTYEEVCRLIGDDTDVGDPATAGADDTLGFLTPLFTKDTASDGTPMLSRHWNKTFRKGDLDEDRGPIPDPDEIRALVTLTPVPPATGAPVRRESNLVKKTIV